VLPSAKTVFFSYLTAAAVKTRGACHAEARKPFFPIFFLSFKREIFFGFGVAVAVVAAAAVDFYIKEMNKAWLEQQWSAAW
jgi:hypothetical protein